MPQLVHKAHSLFSCPEEAPGILSFQPFYLREHCERGHFPKKPHISCLHPEKCDAISTIQIFCFITHVCFILYEVPEISSGDMIIVNLFVKILH